MPLLVALVLWPTTFAQRETAAGDVWSGPPPRPSPGCGVPPPQPLDSLYVGGAERELIADLPSEYDPSRPHDLLLAFHGRTNPNGRVRRYFDLDEAMPQALIVYPQALAAGGGGFSWTDVGDPAHSLRDYLLVEEIVRAFGESFCLDLERVFVTGHSLGASFANALACHRSDLVRAVASVAGGLQVGGGCAGPVAAMLIHHPEDRLVPLSTGAAARNAFLLANGLSSHAPVPSTEPELDALNCVRYGGDRHPVLWCEHDRATTRGGNYYPHNWPSGAAQAIARFFGDLP